MIYALTVAAQTFESQLKGKRVALMKCLNAKSELFWGELSDRNVLMPDQIRSIRVRNIYH